MRRSRGARRATAALAGLVALAVPACSSGSVPHSTPTPSRTASALPSPPPVTPVSWRTCGGGFQCGTVAVPEDYTRTASPLLSLAVSRRLAGKPAQRAGVLFVDFGGPAISGAATLREAAALLPAGLLDRFDLVSFDPRGSGQSKPLRCPQSAALVGAAVGAPVTAAAGQPLPVAAVYRQVYAACQTADPALLATITSTTQARDLDRLRTALGVTRIHYLGLSYGSVLGLAFADLFPNHLAAMVLDSPIDPTEPIATLAEQQAAAAEQALQAYLRGKGSAVASAFAALSARLHRAPVPAPGNGDRTPVSLSDLELATLTFLQQPSLTPQYPSALSAALAGNGRMLRVLASSQYEDVDGTPVIGAYWATLCGDISERPSPVTANTQARALATRYPRLGGVAYAFAGGACTVWPAATQPVGLPQGRAAVAIVGGTQDPIAPYAAAQGLARKLAGSAFITRAGVGHTALANAAGDTCLSNAETAFLTAPGSAPSRVTCTDPAG